MPAITQKERLHYRILLAIKDKTILFEYLDIDATVFEHDSLAVFGAQSLSGDFSAYYVVYRDIYKRFQLFKFTQTSLRDVERFTKAQDALQTAARLSQASLSESNSAIKILGAQPMAPKAMVCSIKFK